MNRRITASEVEQQVVALEERFQKRFSLLEQTAREAALAAERASNIAVETNRKVTTLSDALLTRSPGKEHSAMESLEELSSNLHTIQSLYSWILKLASLLAACGVIYASVKLGIWPEDKP